MPSQSHHHHPPIRVFVSISKQVLCLAMLFALASPLAATSLRQELVSTHRSKTEVSALMRLFERFFPDLHFFEHPIEPILYAVGPREEILRVKSLWKMFDVEGKKWILVAPESAESMELIKRVFPAASTEGGRIQFEGSRYEAKLLQHLCETGTLELPSASGDEENP